VIDAEDVVLGRLAVTVAGLLRGKHKPTFAPHIDTGDFVIVINASKVALTGGKASGSLRHWHSGYPGGLRTETIGDLLARCVMVSPARSTRSTPKLAVPPSRRQAC
jgi:large subunit ribosomal protein L13